jgi:hypothetical protein
MVEARTYENKQYYTHLFLVMKWCMVINLFKIYCFLIIIGKAVPLQAWTGPEGSRRLRLPDFMTFGT